MLWVIAALPIQATHLNGAIQLRVADGLRARALARQQIDMANVGSPSEPVFSPFALTELFTDTAPNQYTLWTQSHRSLYVNGDSICLVYRRVDSRGSGYLSVAYSFDGGGSWNMVEDVNEAAGLLNTGGRYPNCIGFYNGQPVITWPELEAGPAWGQACVALADSLAPYGYCLDDATMNFFHTFGWFISPDTVAIIAFSDNYDIVFYTYDIAGASASPFQIIRNSGTDEGFYPYDVGIYNGRALVYGYDFSTSTDGYLWVNPDGTIDGPYPVFYYVFATASDTMNSITDGTASIDPSGNVWVIYIEKDTLNNAGKYTGNVVMINMADDSTGATVSAFYMPSPSNPDSVFRKFVAYRANLAFHPGGNQAVATFLYFPDTTNYGCPTVTGSSEPPTDIMALASYDGGITWSESDPDLIGDDMASDMMEDMYLLSYKPTYGYNVSYGGEICMTYLTPTDAPRTQLFCNVGEESGVSLYPLIHVSCGQAVGVAEKPKISLPAAEIVVRENGIQVSGPAHIYNAAGSLVATTEGGFVALKSGVYFVKSGNRVQKVVVK